MSDLGVLPGRRWWSASTALLRCAPGACALTAVLAVLPAGGAVPPAVLVITVLLAAGWAAWPHSAAGLVAVFVVLAVWAGAGSEAVASPWLVVASALTAGAHVAGLVSGLAPREASVERALLLLWARRWLAVSAVGLAVWLLDRAAREPTTVSWVWAASVGVLALVTLAGVPALRRNREVDWTRGRNPFRGARLPHAGA